MSTINSGLRNTWDLSGGSVKVDTGTEYAIVGIVPGSLRIVDGGREHQADDEKGFYTGDIRPGRENMSEISFDVYTTGQVHDSSQLLALIRPTYTSGKISNLFETHIDCPDYAGGPGKRRTYASCFCNEKDLPFAASADGLPDKISVKIMSLDSRSADSDYT